MAAGLVATATSRVGKRTGERVQLRQSRYQSQWPSGGPSTVAARAARLKPKRTSAPSHAASLSVDRVPILNVLSMFSMKFMPRRRSGSPLGRDSRRSRPRRLRNVVEDQAQSASRSPRSTFRLRPRPRCECRTVAVDQDVEATGRRPASAGMVTSSRGDRSEEQRQEVLDLRVERIMSPAVLGETLDVELMKRDHWRRSMIGTGSRSDPRFGVQVAREVARLTREIVVFLGAQSDSTACQFAPGSSATERGRSAMSESAISARADAPAESRRQMFSPAIRCRSTKTKERSVDRDLQDERAASVSTRRALLKVPRVFDDMPLRVAGEVLLEGRSSAFWSIGCGGRRRHWFGDAHEVSKIEVRGIRLRSGRRFHTS